MSTQILPRNRGNSSKDGRSNSGQVNSIRDLSQKGRVISGRTLSKNKRVGSNNRHVSRGDLFIGKDDDANGSFGEDAICFNENKNTILSNFEEWIKLSTDNKITSKNSWQFALIDYFHDLNVIKDGENINFQRASATLDGCVKIYLSRVESVATETGRLLSGLTSKKSQIEKQNDIENEGEKLDNEDENLELENADDKKKKRKINRVLESTLVPFESIRMRKLDQELDIDPLFKKALSEFDEGGAKSLLLNTLSIDDTGRVVFDATSKSTGRGSSSATDQVRENVGENDLNSLVPSLQGFLYNDKEELDAYTICPSIGQLQVVLDDVNKAKSVLGDVNKKYSQESQNELEIKKNEDVLDGDGDDDGDNVDFDNLGFEDGEYSDKFEENDNQSLRSMSAPFIATRERPAQTGPATLLDVDLMAYFDENIRTNWRGPENWRVAHLKKKRNLDLTTKKEAASTDSSQSQKKKQATIVNFLDDDNEPEEDIIFATPQNSLSTLKNFENKKQYDNTLPEDIRYNSLKLINLFLKPQQSIVHYANRKSFKDFLDREKTLTDENFFAEQYNAQEEKKQRDDTMNSVHEADFQDAMSPEDDFAGIDFNDALDEGMELNGNLQDNKAEHTSGASPSQLVTGGRKVRPEYVNFSRIAKRVDIKLLKENIWTKLSNPYDESQRSEINEQSYAKTFGDTVRSVGELYEPEKRKDLSTSFCFICLLHLANEHNLSLSTNENFDDLNIQFS